MVDSYQGNVILGNIIVLTARRGKQKLSIKMQIGPLLCFLVMEPSDACGRSEGVFNMRLWCIIGSQRRVNVSVSFPPAVKWAQSCWELAVLVLSISNNSLHHSLLSEQLTLLITTWLGPDCFLSFFLLASMAPCLPLRRPCSCPPATPSHPAPSCIALGWKRCTTTNAAASTPGCIWTTDARIKRL